jgi:hypothetical protein
MQLFEKRHDLYHTLIRWYVIAKQAYQRESNHEVPTLSSKTIFTDLVFDRYTLDIAENRKRVSVTPAQYIEHHIERLSKLFQNDLTYEQAQDKEFLTNEIKAISEILHNVRGEKLKLDQVKFLFEDVAFDSVEKFAEAYHTATNELSNEAFEGLRVALDVFEKTNALEQMREQMKI